jgi:hypothetical protein
MDYSQLKHISKLTVTSLFISMLCISLNATSAHQLSSKEVLASMPEKSAKIYKDSKFIWIEYCPDNTCDVLRAKSGISKTKFSDLALAYYFYYSQYIYLKSWQQDLSTVKFLDAQLSKYSDKSCHLLSRKDLARCVLIAMQRDDKLALFFTRIDEGRKLTKQLSLKEILQ